MLGFSNDFVQVAKSCHGVSGAGLTGSNGAIVAGTKEVGDVDMLSWRIQTMGCRSPNDLELT